MINSSLNETNVQLEDFDTPFGDATVSQNESVNESPSSYSNNFATNFESPFARTYETIIPGQIPNSPVAGDFVNFLSELYEDEFNENLYDLASEVEDLWNTRISNESAMGDNFIPFATREANNYFSPFYNETIQMIDRVSQRFSGNNFPDTSESEIDDFFQQLEFDHTKFSPAQEQLFGSIFKKIKSVVKTGVNLAKKGVAVVGKLLPINIILGRLKRLIKPLLNKVLKYAIGKLPKNLQPYAQTLAKKFLNLETSGDIITESGDIPATGNFEAIQTELDGHIANLVFSTEDVDSENLIMNYESSSDDLERQNDYETNGVDDSSLNEARNQFISELKELQPGESPAPAIERFLPVAIQALRPLIKMGISIVGRKRVVNFLAGILAKLVSKFVPQNVAKPLSVSIIDTGMRSIGFEIQESDESDLAYEAIANTIQETIQNMDMDNEASLDDQESLMSETLEAFEKAAANNFPAQYLKANLRLTSDTGTWVLMPRSGRRHLYKKYTKIFDSTIDNNIASSITTFRGIPLNKFLKDKLDIDLSTPVKARVHLYEGIGGTKLYLINRFEKIPGLGIRYGYKQLHPLSVQAASLLLKEPKLGKDFPAEFTTKRFKTAIGQRFYFLEIPGARLKTVSVALRGYRRKTGLASSEIQDYTPAVPNSGDVQGTINFVRNEIKLFYYFSEEEARAIVEKLNSNDYSGAFMNIRNGVKNVLHGILISNIGNKIKIVHEAMPEMFLESYDDSQEHFLFSIGKTIGKYSQSAYKDVVKNLIEKLINRISDRAYYAVINYFKSRANEFKDAQTQPQDGVTLKLTWTNIQGMSNLSTIINAFKSRLSTGNISNLNLPKFPAPEVQVLAGKNFD